jgi:hypothetical protein
VAGNAYKYNQEETLPGIAFRGVNESYVESTGIVNPAVEQLFIMGGISKVDRALVKTQGNVNDLRARYDAMKSKACALTFTAKFFSGDNESDPKEFDGLQKRLTGGQLLDAGSTSGGDALTLDALDELLDAVQGGADVLFCNKIMRRKISALVRTAGQSIEVVNDAFGRQLTAYAATPIGIIEEDKDGDQILAFDENDSAGDSASCTSIYAVRFGVAEYVSGLQAGSMDVLDQGLQTTFYQTLIEWICGLGVFHPKAAARLQAIKNA